jgi:hypothetical protein
MSKDYIIYSNKQDLQQGMFGQALIWLLEVLYDLEKFRLINDDSKIVFNINAEAYDNIIPTFVRPKVTYDSQDLFKPRLLDMTGHFKAFKKHEFAFSETSFYEANRIWNRFFVISDDIMARIPNIDSTSTLGIHYRGTDKNVQYNEANEMTQVEFIQVALDCLMRNPHFKYIYCCSDETSFIANLKARLPAGIEVIEYIRAQTDDNVALHRLTASAYIDKQLKDELTISAFVDMLALSRCNMVLKTNSALSAFSKIINPSLQLYTANAMKERWFPTGVVLPYKTDSNDINAILARTMRGHQYDVS